MRFSDFFIYPPFIFFALACAAFVFRCGFRPLTKAVWTVWLLFAFSKFWCFTVFFGNTFNPELPAAVLIAWDAVFLGAVLLSLISVAFLFRFRYKGVVLPVVAWGAAAFSVYCGIAAPGVKPVEVAFPDLPPSLDGYRIAQISDLHCSAAMRGWRTAAVTERTNRLDADLVCLTGDYVDGCLSDREKDMLPLKGLKARDGVYWIAGNHEYYRDGSKWRKWFRDNGMRFLANECVFPRPQLALGGVNDPVAARYGDVAPDVGRAFAYATNGQFRVLLQHRPQGARENIGAHSVDLQLSGHTHGGVAPLIRDFIAACNGGFVLGLYRLDGGALYVSPGTGQWGGVLSRFLNPSEITLITLRRR